MPAPCVADYSLLVIRNKRSAPRRAKRRRTKYLLYVLRNSDRIRSNTYKIDTMMRRCFEVLIMAVLTSVRAAKAPTKTLAKPECTLIHIEDIYSDQWRLSECVDILKRGGVGIIPTDTCYSFVTDINNKEGLLRILRLKDEGMKKPLSVLCPDISTISKYSSNLADQKWVFKILKSTLPGPYTFILPSSKEVPSVLVEHKKHMRRWKRKEIGVRIPEDAICSYLTSNMDASLISGSVPEYGEDLDIVSYSSLEEDEGAEEMEMEDEGGTEEARDVANNQQWISRWTRSVDFIVDCGERGVGGRSTVVDLTTGAAVVLRQGSGAFDPDAF